MQTIEWLYQTFGIAVPAPDATTQEKVEAFRDRHQIARDQLGANRADLVNRYRILIRNKMEVENIDSPLLAAARLIDGFAALNGERELITNIALCAAIELCQESSLNRCVKSLTLH